MNLPRILSLLIVLVLTPAPVLASVVQQLYSASIPVSSQSDQAREQALHQALRQVIVKVTGSRAAPDDPQVAAIVAQPEHYLQAYRYTRHVPGPNEPLFGPGASATLDLIAQFDQPTLDQALRAAGQPLWGSERPETIVWIAYQQANGQRHIVGSEAPGEVFASVQHAAKLRGVPIIFPLMDVQDRAHIAFSDIWGGFISPIMQASQRYQPDAILIGRIDANGVNASPRWTLVMGGKTTNWDGVSGAAPDVARAAIQHLADVYASTFVIRNGAGAQRIPTLDIVVSNIDGLQSFGRVLKYLRSLNALDSVEPMQFHGGVVIFKASAQGTVKDIRQTIGLGTVLKADDTPRPPSLPGAQTANQPVSLRYLYQPW